MDEVFSSIGIYSGSFEDQAATVLSAFVFVAISFYGIIAPKRIKKIKKTEVPEGKDSAAPGTPAPTEVSFAQRLQKGLSKTRHEVWDKVGGLLSKSHLTEEEEEQVEEILYGADLSPSIVDEIITKLKKNKEGDHKAMIKELLREKMAPVQDKMDPSIHRFDKADKQLKVIMIVGVNGAGKTTTIGKLATRLKNSGAKVVVGACDTFRAAAVEQLEVWCDKAGVTMVKAPDNAQPSGVAFDTVAKAKEMGADYCIIDTAGRLHTASNLMEELKKTKKVMSKVIPEAPHETFLVIDAITGQNAMKQAEEFNKTLDLTGLVFTKCDGSSKAGSAVGIVDGLKVPIVYIGVGEEVKDLDVFHLNAYLDALVGS